MFWMQLLSFPPPQTVVFPQTTIAVSNNNLEIAWVLIQYPCFQSFWCSISIGNPGEPLSVCRPMVTIHTLWRLTVIVWTRMQQGRCVQVWVPFPKLIFSRSRVVSTAAWSSLHTSSRTKRSFTGSNRGFKSKCFQMTSGSWSPVREKRRESSECLSSELQWRSQTQTHVSASRWGTDDTYTLTHKHCISANGDERKAKRDADTLTPCLPRFYLSHSITAVFMSLARSVFFFLALYFHCFNWCLQHITIEIDVIIQIHNI